MTDNADSDSTGVMSTQSPHDAPPSGISRLEASHLQKSYGSRKVVKARARPRRFT